MIFVFHCVGLAQQCTERFMDLSFARYNAQSIGTASNDGMWPLNNVITILQEYQFNCSHTKITSLILGIDVRINSPYRQLVPSVQIFRSTTDGIHHGNNQYALVPGSERYIYYSTSNASNNGVFEYPLDPPILVLRGDLLAVSQPNEAKSYIRIYIKIKSKFVTQEFFFGSKTIRLLNGPSRKKMVLVYPFTG